MLINKKHIRAYALGVAEGRAHKFTRVGKEFMIRADEAMRLWIRKEIQSLPSKGKTILSLTLLCISIEWLVYTDAVAGQSIPDKRAVNAIIGEAEGEEFKGKLAVACAIRNRGSLQGVYGERSPRVRKAGAKARQDSERAWRESADPRACTFIDGATHWEGTSFRKPYWAMQFVVTAVIGNQVFYRERRESEEPDLVDYHYAGIGK